MRKILTVNTPAPVKAGIAMKRVAALRRTRLVMRARIAARLSLPRPRRARALIPFSRVEAEPEPPSA